MVADADLVAAAGAGDKEAFGRLIQRHRPMALRLARRLLGGEELALDALQEATLGALVGIDRLRSPDRFGAWFAGIALNVGRRMLRERSRQAALGRWDGPDGHPGPDEQAEAAELGARVRAAVATLALGQREAVLAFYWQGLTHAEAAIELGISPGAVKARLHQARQVLNTSLAVYQPTEVPPMSAEQEPSWVEMTVSEVRRGDVEGPPSPAHAVILREREGSRLLPIWMGPPEATALACSLEQVEFPRPMTYQLAASLLQASGARVREVRINRVLDYTYYAAVMVDGPTGPQQVDSRPSDALNLALVVDAPIRVEASILDDEKAVGHTDWQAYPEGTTELVAEVRQRQTWIGQRPAP